jgi:lysophospholipase L1-like esterase
MKKIILFCLFLFVIFLIFIKKESIRSDVVVTSNSVILAFGDSITYGFGAKDNESYPSVLENILNIKVINSGINGEVSADGLKRLPQVLENVKPNLVILCHGGNDILRKHDLQKTKQNIMQMIDIIRSYNADVILVGVPNLEGFFIQTADFYKEIAKEKSVIFEGEIIEKIIKSPRLKSDQIHPNKDGYEEIAKTLANLINSNFR